MRRFELTGAEKSWLAAMIVGTLLLVEIPYLLAYSQVNRGFVFTGMLWSPHDFAQYAAAMRQGADGPSWLIHNPLTAEPHQAVLMYPLYVGLGKVAAALGLELQLIFHLSQVASRGALLLAIYVFCGAIFSTVNERRVAFLLAAFSSGLAFWMLLLDSVFDFAGDSRWILMTDHTVPEVSTFLVLFTAPHLMLGLALVLFAAYAYLASWSAPGLRYPLGSALAVFGLTVANPFSIVTLGAAQGAHLALLWLMRHAAPRSALLSAGMGFLAVAPFLAYNVLVFGADPFWSETYGRQNVTPSPPLPYLALGVGPVLVLACLGLSGFLRAGTPGHWLVLIWIAVSLTLMYLPLAIGFQRRFAFGLQPMLAIIAAVTLEPIWRSLHASQMPTWRTLIGQRLLRYGAIVALFSSTACFYALRLHAATHPVDRVGHGGAFQPVSVQEIGRWLAGVMDPADVVLAESPTGNYLASVVPGRVFVGHPVATLDYTAKEEAMRQFYYAEDDEGRRRFLLANNIRYVVYGPLERALGAPLPPSSGYLRPAYGTAEFHVYEVETPVAEGSLRESRRTEAWEPR